MALAPLPTLWNLYNLLGSPYFQDILEASPHSTRPLDPLFVGRENELRGLTQTIYGAADQGTRQAIAGIPGVGKTTLVQELKSLLQANAYLTTDSLVPLLPNDTAEAIFGRVLGNLYDTILANRPHTAEHRAMQDAQVLVRATRLAGGGFSASVYGAGVGGTRSYTALSPKDLMIDGPRVMRDLVRLVRGADARGVIIHINNLETLSESDTARAAEIFRGLRDLMLMHDGLHFLLVGTTEAVNTIVDTYVQVRNIFGTIQLHPFNLADVNRMLAARYKHLRADARRPPIPPADHAAVAELYSLYRGDLRGLLKALEDGVAPLLGLVGTLEPSGPDSPTVRPLRLDEIRPALQERYRRHLESLPEQKRIEQLVQWGETDPSATHTQATLSVLWGITQGPVSTALKHLTQQGYVIALPRRGIEPIEYVLSGTSRLIFG